MAKTKSTKRPSSSSRGICGAFRFIFIGNEILIRVLILLVGLLFQFYYTPFVREVQGKDWPDYAYPYKTHQMFSELAASLVILFIALVVLLAGLALLRWRGKWSWGLLGAETGLFLLAITLSGALDFMACTIIKKMYGRLRPDYLSRCFGNNDPAVWMPANGFASWEKIPEIPTCNTKAGTFNLSQDDLDDGRMSFPSAHSSLSFAILGFVSLWTYSKLCLFRDWGSWRIVLPFGVMMVPITIAVSRTSDYRHHSSDVIGGIIIGVIIALLSFCFYFPITMVPLATSIYTAYSAREPTMRLQVMEAAMYNMGAKDILLAPEEVDNRTPLTQITTTGKKSSEGNKRGETLEAIV